MEREYESVDTTSFLFNISFASDNTYMEELARTAGDVIWITNGQVSGAQ
jgi:hypothetical protein